MKTPLVVPFVLALSAVGAAQPSAPTGNAKRGEQTFMKQNCYYCHGTAAQGSPRDGARLARTALSLPRTIAYVRKPAGAMPAYTEKILTDQELTDIYAYLQSLPAAKPLKEIPLLDQLK